MGSASAWKTAALAACSLLAALFLAEGIVRLAGLGQTFLTRGPLHEYDPLAGWRCKSGLDASYVRPGSFDVRIRCNGLGLRGGEVEQPKPAGRTRVAVLGDSFMWGYGVENEQVFARALTRHLPGSDSVNLAANGYSTVQSLVRLEDVGLALDPDVVIVGFFWNDLEDNFDDKGGGRPIAAVGEDGALRIENLPVRRRWKSGAKQWLRHRSRLFGFLDYAFKSIGEGAKHRFARAAEPDGPEPGGAPGPERVDPGLLVFSEREIYAPPISALDRAWEGLRLVLARIAAEQRARGGRTLVMYVPSRNAVTRDGFREQVGDDPELDWNRPAERLGGIATSLGVGYLDLNPVFRAAPEPMSLFLVGDGHWSAAGHELAARAASAALRADADPER